MTLSRQGCRCKALQSTLLVVRFYNNDCNDDDDDDDNDYAQEGVRGVNNKVFEIL